MRLRPHRLIVAPLVLAAMTAVSTPIRAQEEPPAPAAGADRAPADAGQALPEPRPIPEFSLPTLPTIPVPRRPPGPNWFVADTAPLPKDREGIWVLEFSFKPVRLIEVEIPGKGRRKVHYMYYKIVNRTGEPRQLVPQLTLVTDEGKRYEETVLPRAVRLIQAKEDGSKPLLGAVENAGTLPPSTKDGIDDAVYGVAIWDNVDFKADAFSVYVRGLSDAFQVDASTEGGQPVTRYKALRIDFARPGDERSPHSREIQIKDPPFEWVYFPEPGSESGRPVR